MRGLPDLVIQELAKQAIMICHLFKLVAASTYRMTDCDQDVYFDGNYWSAARQIRFDDFQFSITGGIPSISFSFPNADKWLSNLALGQDIRNKEFTIYRVLLNASLAVIGYTDEDDMSPIFRGFIDEIPTIDRLTGRINVVSHRITERGLGPRGDFSPQCWKKFKSTECKYVDGTVPDDDWCDMTKTRCVYLQNQVNFGGWEYIADLATKDVYWGQRVKQWGSTK